MSPTAKKEDLGLKYCRSSGEKLRYFPLFLKAKLTNITCKFRPKKKMKKPYWKLSVPILASLKL
jgi:hypothetical protein